MLKKVLLVLAVALGGFAVFVATRPDTYHVERSTTIKAAPEAVFTTMSDLRKFSEWSPWEKRDPAMKKTLSANTTGPGASMAWQGNSQVGSGKMTIVESTPPTKVKQKLEFMEPFPSVADVTWEIAPAGAGEAKATWAMDGQNNFISKAFGVFMNMDQMIGKDFDEGLANLKRVVESAPAAPAAAPAAAAAAPAEAAPTAKQ